MGGGIEQPPGDPHTWSPEGEMKTGTRVAFVLLLALTLALAVSATAFAADPDVTVTTGPTTIINGTCMGAHDITIQNGIFAIAIAVDTMPPWGVPKGSILDGALVKDGVPGLDRLTLIDFLPNAWAAWPNTSQTIEVTTNTADKAVVTVTRDYDKMSLVTTIEVDRGSKFAGLSTVVTDPLATGQAYTDIYPGYTFCTNGGYMFGPFNVGDYVGLYRPVSDPYGKYVLGYDQDFAFGLHNPKADQHDGGTGWKDLYTKSSFVAGDSKTFDAVAQFEAGPSISPFVKEVIDERADPFGTVSGSVTAGSGAFTLAPLVVVEKDGEAFTWVECDADGKYSLDLPVGSYQLYAVAKGYSASAKSDVSVTASGSVTQDFSGLVPQSKVTVKVTRAGTSTPIDARINVTGGTPPLIGYLGKSVFFTDLKKVGRAEFNVAPGDYTFIVTAGDSFTTKAAEVPVKVEAGKNTTVSVKIKRILNPEARRWFSADMHHHSNILDGITPPEYVVRSQLAAGLDFTYLSDHDSFANDAETAALSASRGVPFVPSDEISPIWAHFNVLPLSLKKPVTIDPTGTAQQIIDAAHEAGLIININHPYIAYGYFYADDQDSVPGGYSDDFDGVEIQSTHVTKSGDSPDELTLARAMGLWTTSLTGENKRHYLNGGTDTHDVWSWISGTTRTYVRIPAPLKLNAANFTAAVKAGHSYVTEGPLVQPLGGIMFGDTARISESRRVFPVSLKVSAVDGLKSVTVLRAGKVCRTVTFGDDTDTTSDVVMFNLKSTAKTWYSFIVEDQDGHRAVTNPVWTKMVK
jgi:hypothetical protein